jgi:sugar lactone lactonase YvrE
VEVTAALSSLAANTTYHFRISATNAGGTSKGSDETFKSLPNPPTVVTKAASAIAQTTATATATVNPNGGEVSKCEFEYGTTIAYGSTASCATLPGSGSSAVEVTAALSSLTANTTYHFRISATNAGGVSKGSDETFKTLPSLVITTASLPGGFLGTPYSQTLAASGGITPYAWSVTAGALPGGLSLNSETGAITGTPAAAGNASFTIMVSDSSIPTQTASANLSINIAEPTYTTAIASYESPEARFSEPNAVAIDPGGDMFIADSGHDRIVELNSERKFLRQFGEAGSGEGQFSGIGGIATNSSGDLYVSDEGNNRIQEFGPAGEHLRTFGAGTILAPGPLSSPAAIAIDSSGDVWVLNAYGSPEGGRIAEFSATGTLITKFGSTGSTEGKLGISSFGLAISGGDLYVSEYGNQRVQEFSTAGAYLGSFDPAGSGTGKSDEPWGIATDPASGNLYVSELGGDRVQEFSAAGAFITTFGSQGSGSGQLQSPRGIAVSSSGQISIADTGNSRVEQWAP